MLGASVVREEISKGFTDKETDEKVVEIKLLASKFDSYLFKESSDSIV